MVLHVRGVNFEVNRPASESTGISLTRSKSLLWESEEMLTWSASQIRASSERDESDSTARSTRLLTRVYAWYLLYIHFDIKRAPRWLDVQAKGGSESLPIVYIHRERGVRNGAETKNTAMIVDEK